MIKMEQKKKILYVVTKSDWGGAQKYVFDLATSLPKEEYQVIVAFGGHGTLERRLSGEGGIRTLHIESLERDISLLKEFSVFKELLRIYRREKPDIVHLNSSKIGGLGSLAARFAGVKKIIFTAHGWAFNEKTRNIVSRFIIWKLSIWTALLCTDIIVLSKKEQKQAHRFFVISQKKIHLIRNGVKPFAHLPRTEAREKLGLEENETYIGTIAELHKNKGLDVLLRTLPHLDAQLVLIGSGEEEGRLKNLSRDLEISEKVHFLGAIDQASLYNKAFDVFTLPSRKEGLPYVLLEAGHVGVPVVATNVGGVPEIILTDNTGVLVRPDNTEDLKDALEKMLHNTEYAARTKRNLKEYIKNNFSFEKTLKLTEELY